MTAALRILPGMAGGLLLTAAGVLLMRLGYYGLTLFLVMPVFIGLLGAWLIPQRVMCGAVAGGLCVGFASVALVLLGQEGAICTLMVLPLSLPLGVLGGAMVTLARRRNIGHATPTMLALAPIATLGWDATAPPPVYEVRTSIEINAPPEKVWKHVVAFPELPEPTEWIFRAGVAYPQRARIEGSGVGAIRYCEFSTGAFVEPIEVWREPQLLRFQVTENPAPMREWSPHGEVKPKHLHGYMISKRGEFRLTPLAGGRTLIEGTTWYQHGLRPANYWRAWSDVIIHNIHLRVLRHIQRLAE